MLKSEVVTILYDHNRNEWNNTYTAEKILALQFAENQSSLETYNLLLKAYEEQTRDNCRLREQERRSADESSRKEQLTHVGRVLREDREPCKHPGCMSHVSHPCEGCGRQWGRRGNQALLPSGRKLSDVEPKKCRACGYAGTGMVSDVSESYNELSDLEENRYLSPAPDPSIILERIRELMLNPGAPCGVPGCPVCKRLR